MTLNNLVIVVYTLAVLIGTISSYYLLDDWRRASTKEDPFWCSVFPYTVLYMPFTMVVALIVLIQADCVAIAFKLPGFVHDAVNPGYYLGLIVLCEIATWLFMVARPRHVPVLA